MFAGPLYDAPTCPDWSGLMISKPIYFTPSLLFHILYLELSEETKEYYGPAETHEFDKVHIIIAEIHKQITKKKKTMLKMSYH